MNNKDDKKKNPKRIKIMLSSLVAATMATVLAFSTMAPATAFSKVNDNASIDDYKTADSYKNTSTKNAGRIWSDKSVLKAGEKVDGQTFNLEQGEDFNVVYSLMGSAQRIKQDGKARAFDVSFVLDISKSMGVASGSNSQRIIDSIAAINTALYRGWGGLPHHGSSSRRRTGQFPGSSCPIWRENSLAGQGGGRCLR